MKNKTSRWELAQHYEHNWWKKRKETVGTDYYKNSAEEIRSFFTSKKELEKETCILEIGSGSWGILTYLTECSNRFAIDPLEDFYSSIPAFINKRDKSVNYLCAKGESLPFADKMFDLIIIDNVLDHCEDPILVMKEVKRVIKLNGSIYFRQNTYNCYGKFARSLMELFKIDKGHPHTFLKKELIALLSTNNFKIAHSKNTGYYSYWITELTSKSIKDKIKALLFITRDKVTYCITNQKD